MKGIVKCRHCGKHLWNRARGLCWRCHSTPEILQMYPVQSPYAYRSREHNGGYAIPGQPTQAPPGSDAKVEEMVKRAEAGTRLWHPQDAQGVRS